MTNPMHNIVPHKKKIKKIFTPNVNTSKQEEQQSKLEVEPIGSVSTPMAMETHRFG